MNINIDNSKAIFLAAQEIMETTGQLWVNFGGEDIYIPELLAQIEKLQNKEKLRD
jgi:hypothetical protein